MKKWIKEQCCWSGGSSFECTLGMLVTVEVLGEPFHHQTHLTHQRSHFFYNSMQRFTHFMSMIGKTLHWLVNHEVTSPLWLSKRSTSTINSARLRLFMTHFSSWTVAYFGCKCSVSETLRIFALVFHWFMASLFASVMDCSFMKGVCVCYLCEVTASDVRYDYTVEPACLRWSLC